MAERDSLWTMNGATRVLDAEDARVGTTAMLVPGATVLRGRQGLRPGAGNPGKVVASGTPDVNVKVEKFMAVVTATRGLGEYIATLDADKTMNILGTTPAHGSLQRNHLIIGRQTDTYYLDGSTAFTVMEVIGVAGAGDPSLAAYPDYIPLARLRIPANATTITNAMIDDLRPPWVAALGGLLGVTGTTDRATLTPYNGFPIYRLDRKWIEIHDGTAWRVQGVAICSNVADLAAVTDPVTGQQAWLTGVGSRYVYDGAVWMPEGVLGGRIIDQAGFIGTTSGTVEKDFAKLALEGRRIVSGRVYELHLNLFWNFATVATGDSYIVRIRKDTPLTGTVIAEWVIRPVDASAFDESESFEQPWRCTATDTNGRFYVSITRVAGTGTLSLNGDKKTAFWVVDRGSDTAVWASVP